MSLVFNGAWRVARCATAVCLLCTILISSLAVNALQLCCLCLIVFPFHKRLRWVQSLGNLWWDAFLFCIEGFGGVDIRWSGDAFVHDDNAILVGNHSGGLDFMTGVAIANRAGIGNGRMSCLMKSSLQWLPAIGFTQKLCGSLFLKRDWAQDHKALDQKLAQMSGPSYPRPFYFGVFPEGTRITPEKKRKSHEFATSRGLPVLDHVLLPRSKGFVYIVDKMRDSVDCVYDVTIAYSPVPMFVKDLLLHGRFRTTAIHIDVSRTPIKDIPKQEDALSKWLLDAWIRKDKLLATFHAEGRFSGKTEFDSLPNVGRLSLVYLLISFIGKHAISHFVDLSPNVYFWWFVLDLFAVISAAFRIHPDFPTKAKHH